MNNKDLKKRIIDLSYEHKLSHLSSCLTSVDIIDHIYGKRREDDPFILSAGHAGLSLYVVLEKYLGKDAEELLEKYGVHPSIDKENGIYCSTGSLGQGLPIAVGIALSSPEKQVYCLVSDGETAEGSIWEALRIIEDQKLSNLEVHVNINGWGAYHEVDRQKLIDRLYAFHYPKLWFTNVRDFPFLVGQDAHYKVMNEEEYKQALEVLQ
jgi:transketolase